VGIPAHGRRKKKDGKRIVKPIDWRGVFEALRTKRGLSRDAILDLTAPQLFAEIGDTEGGPPTPVSRAELSKRTEAKRDEMFARICREDNLTPHQFSRLPRAEIVLRVSRACGGKPVDANMVPAWAIDFAKRAETNSCH
jgi:hypothetical protein